MFLANPDYQTDAASGISPSIHTQLFLWVPPAPRAMSRELRTECLVLNPEAQTPNTPHDARCTMHAARSTQHAAPRTQLPAHRSIVCRSFTDLRTKFSARGCSATLLRLATAAGVLIHQRFHECYSREIFSEKFSKNNFIKAGPCFRVVCSSPEELKGVPRSRSKVFGSDSEIDKRPDRAPWIIFRVAARSGQVVVTERRVFRSKTVDLGFRWTEYWPRQT